MRPEQHAAMLTFSSPVLFSHALNPLETMGLPQQCRGNKMMNKKDGNKIRRKDVKMNF
jgi:hypothetical protein